jgi:hypothetical protein
MKSIATRTITLVVLLAAAVPNHAQYCIINVVNNVADTYDFWSYVMNDITCSHLPTMQVVSPNQCKSSTNGSQHA